MILKARRELLPAILALTLVAPAFAGSPGTTTGELLKIPVGIRAVGMGEAFTGLANDSSALYWNPAGLSRVYQKEATFQHSSLIEGVHYEHLAFVAPRDTFSMGANFSYLGYGDIAGFDNAGNATGDVSAHSYILNGGVSKLFFGSLSLGVSGGLIHESLADESANSFAANAGVIYSLPAHPWSGDYHLGAAVQNLGPGLKFVEARDPLPRKIKFGVAAEGIKKLPLNLTLDATMPNDNDAYVSFGSEYWFKELIAMRLGYAGSNDEGRGLRVGFGVKYNGLLLDYAYAGFGDFGATNRVGLSFRFGDRIRQLNGDERAILKEAKLYEKEKQYVPAILAYDELVDRDPTNEHILHYMIMAHDRMAKEMGDTQIAQKSAPIPSPEDAALAELVPESNNNEKDELAKALDFDDPLGLNKLPEVNTLDVSAALPIRSLPEAVVIVPTPEAAMLETPPTRSERPANGPALSPADIYGN